MTASPREKPRVALFVTCLVDLFRPSVGFAAVKLLEDAGCDVFVPSQTCCGQPAYNSGDRALAKALAQQVIDAFSAYDYIVAPSGSCARHARQHYPGLFVDDPNLAGKANDFAAKVHELSSFLTDVLGVERVNASFERRVTYHDSCSGLRELGVERAAAQVAGERRRAGADRNGRSRACCGFGGTFARQIRRNLRRHRRATRSQNIVSDAAPIRCWPAISAAS